MKTLLERDKTLSIDIDRLFKFTVFHDDDNVESVISSLSREAVSIWLLSEILSRLKELCWQTLEKIWLLKFRVKSEESIWTQFNTQQSIFREHYENHWWLNVIEDSCIDLSTDKERCKWKLRQFRENTESQASHIAAWRELMWKWTE